MSDTEEHVDESGLVRLKKPEASQPVVVTGFNMPFGELVLFMVKFVIATIPAAIILVALLAALVAVFGGIGGVGA